MTNLNDLKIKCKNWQSDNQGFSDIIKLACESNPELQIKLADEFEVAPSTIRRWANGVSFPLWRMQKLIIKFIEDILD